MKTAFAVWNNRIAPVFDVARRVIVVGPAAAGGDVQTQVLLTGDPPLIDGVDLRRIDLDAWRRRLAVVPQRPFLFSDSGARRKRRFSGVFSSDGSGMGVAHTHPQRRRRMLDVRRPVRDEDL